MNTVPTSEMKSKECFCIFIFIICLSFLRIDLEHAFILCQSCQYSTYTPCCMAFKAQCKQNPENASNFLEKLFYNDTLVLLLMSRKALCKPIASNMLSVTYVF